METGTEADNRTTTVVTRIPVAERVTNHRRRRVAAIIGLTLLMAALVTGLELYQRYSVQEAFIDARLADHSLLLPAGVYTAPRHLATGRHIRRSELIEQLWRAGYLSGAHADEFVSGSFTAQANTIVLRTHQHLTTERLPAVVSIALARDAGSDDNVIISAIRNDDTQQPLVALELPTELLAADLNARMQTRRPVSFDDLPPQLVQAVIAIEDRRFFEHSGVDLKAMGRALLRNWRSGEVREGGSTITQQFIKNQFLTPERSYHRKLNEALMAIALERRLSKQQILTLYCDRVYLGHSGLTAIYGFRQAARVYLGKELSELSLSEAALLAGLIKAPNYFSPYTQPERALARRNQVLTAMTETGAITAAQAAAARTEQIHIRPAPEPDDNSAPYFLDYLQRETARQHFSEGELAHLRIETTLDPDLQQAANQVVREHLARLDRLTAAHNKDAHPEAALIALDPQTGEILAMVGGRNYAQSHFNRATDAMRQPGSVFKPFVYAAALSRGVPPTTTFQNAVTRFDYGYKAVYTPHNFGNSYSNQPVMLRDGIVRSLNVVAVAAALETGLARVADLAENAGLPRPGLYPSMALGAFEATPLDVACAYTVFAAEGLRADPMAIRAIRNGSGPLFEGSPTRSGVLSAATAWVVTDTLADVVNQGTARRIRQMGYRGPAAGKTGTSRDAWFAGYTPRLLVVVWVGYDDHRDLNLTGGEAAAPIWADFIKRALAVRPDLSAREFSRPGGIEAVEIDTDNGLLANEFCPHRRRMLLPMSLLPSNCFAHHAPELPETIAPDDVNLLTHLTPFEYQPEAWPGDFKDEDREAADRQLSGQAAVTAGKLRRPVAVPPERPDHDQR